MGSEREGLAAEFAALVRLIDGQPPAVRELLHYALVMLMVEDEKADIVERRTIDARHWIFVRTSAGELFSVAQPDVGDDVVAHLLEVARDVRDVDRTGPEEG